MIKLMDIWPYSKPEMLATAVLLFSFLEWQWNKLQTGRKLHLVDAVFSVVLTSGSLYSHNNIKSEYDHFLNVCE